MRATAATGMNRHSSRSHAVFTITLEQRRRVRQAQSSSASVEASLPLHLTEPSWMSTARCLFQLALANRFQLHPS